ncbi:AAA family ATPase [Mycolicibacterium bacteremicum]|uniref:Nuclease SbcCD subunit C n=1 Tax=Mycolicibacterium bacteremicum TaxID=564198 RepID=A0A1W9YSI1_MYCBA|nr:AAA family ATPase [Mycolicibacterium bacteremicum]ORA03031.1 hypothetical protein BST17_20820 [Mycolicibacterium bacteremicum]
MDHHNGVSTADVSPTYLTNITVSGFRGIGSTAKLDLHPAPGLTVISGRNGSGKSSFAEAVELALTGSSYRWRGKQALWSESWRNLHKPNPCALRVGFTREGSKPVKVGVDWDPEAELADRTLWTQRDGKQATDGICTPAAVQRPIPQIRHDTKRLEWDMHDLDIDGVGVEVKSAAYV